MVQPTDSSGEGRKTQATAAPAAAEGPAPQAAAHTSPIHTSKVTLSRKCHHPILAATQMTMLDFSQLSFEFFNRLIHLCTLMHEREKLLYHSSTREVMFSDLQKGLQPELEIKLELLKWSNRIYMSTQTTCGHTHTHTVIPQQEGCSKRWLNTPSLVILNGQWWQGQFKPSPCLFAIGSFGNKVFGIDSHKHKPACGKACRKALSLSLCNSCAQPAVPLPQFGFKWG